MGSPCGDTELVGYLATQPVVGPSAFGPGHSDHTRWGSISDPTLNGHLHYPNDIDWSLNEARLENVALTIITIPLRYLLYTTYS